MHPILFELGPLKFYSYGLLLAVGFFVAMELSVRRAGALGLDRGRIQSAVFVALLSGLVGARLAYVFLYWELFRANPIEIIRLDHGGLIFYGGFFAGMGAVLVYLKRHRLPVRRAMDLMIPPLTLAQAIGRIGCFANGCCYGKPTALPWAVAVPPDGNLHHPTQLYETAALMVLFLILKALERRKAPPLTVTLVYGLGYGAWRFFNEFLRADTERLLWGLTPFQWASVGLILVCGVLLLRRK